MRSILLLETEFQWRLLNRQHTSERPMIKLTSFAAIASAHKGAIALVHCPVFATWHQN